MVTGKFVSSVEDLSIVSNLQYTIFRDELQLSAEAMEDAFCTHALVYDKEEPVGFGSVSYDGDEFRLVRVGILEPYRGQMYGDFMVRLLFDKVAMSGGTVMHADVLEGTERFFETIGFKTAGVGYQRGNATWIPMKLESGQMHTCCGCHK